MNPDVTVLILLSLDWLQPIPGFPGYWITRYGDVLSLRAAGLHRRSRWAWLTQRPRPDRKGRHLRVDLYQAGRKRTMKVHRLVALAWIDTRSIADAQRLQVCHKNGDAQHNEVDNLYFGTNQENSLDRERHRREREDHESGQASFTSCNSDSFESDPFFGGAR